jgi:DNA-binding CsgD family transcriptional regulator
MARRLAKAHASARPMKRVDSPAAAVFGRERDIAMIESLLGKIHDGGAALMIGGEPGIGKSTLLDVAQDLARDRGIRVLRLCGAPSETHLSFSGLQQALGPALHQVDTLPRAQRAALEAAFGLGEEATAPDLFLVGLATLTLLTQSAVRKPILMAADDIQWLDQPSREVLAFIARRIGSDPIVLLMAARSGSEEALTPSGVQRHELTALDPSAAERLLDAQAPGLPNDMRRRFLSAAGGNPLALVELPRSDRNADTGNSPWLSLTDRLQTAFLTRVSSLPAATRALLLIIAENDGRSLGETLTAGEVLLGGKVELDALAPAVSAQLIDIAAGEVGFRHPLIRSAVHQAASPVTRHRVHAALAQVIEDRSGRGIWHRMASAIAPDEALAQELDGAAARSHRRGALATAIIALESAARFSADAEAKSERLLRAAALAVDLGHPEAVERLLRQADVEGPEGHMGARLAWIREIGRPLTLTDVSRISALTRFAAEARAHGDDDLAAGLLWRAVQHCWWSNAGDEVRAGILSASKELALPADDARMIAIAGYAAPLANGHEVYGQLAAYAAAASEDPTAAWILGVMGNAIGAYEISVGLLSAASAAYREHGRLGYLGRVLYGRGCAETETGDWSGALRSCAEAARLAEETRQTVWVAAAMIVQAMIEARRGHFDAAAAHVGQADQLLLSPGSNFWRATGQQARGIIATGEGRPAEAYEHFSCIWTPGAPAFSTALQFYCLADYVEAAVSCDQEAAAAAAVAEIERRARPVAVPWVRLILSYCKALLAPVDQAEALFQEALGADAQTWPFRHGCCLLAYGAWLRRQRRITDARPRLRAARDIFDALGAAPWSERARRELRGAGESSRPREGRALDTLTPQELQIAELASTGLSNKEIGAKLYLSHRTIGYHLQRIYSKTEITSRARLTRVLANGAGRSG